DRPLRGRRAGPVRRRGGSRLSNLCGGPVRRLGRGGPACRGDGPAARRRSRGAVRPAGRGGRRSRSRREWWRRPIPGSGRRRWSCWPRGCCSSPFSSSSCCEGHVSIRLEIRAGERVGQAVTVDKTYLTIGRHVAADLRFEAYYEVPISARHAAVVAREGGYVVRDLGSAAGTFLNGQRVIGDVPLASGDMIELGRGGPATQVTFMPVPINQAPLEARVTAGRTRPTPAELRLRPAPSGGITIASIEQTSRRRQAAVRKRGMVAGLVVLLGITGYVWQATRSGAREELLRRQMRDTAQRQREIISTAMLD